MVGANPPLGVIEGYVRRIWGQFAIDKVVAVRKGLYLVRFGVMADKEEVLKKGIYYFDRKPFIVKALNENLNMDTNDIRSLPIWVQFLELDVKYWGADSLSKISNVTGMPLKTDKQTMDKTFLSFASVLINIPLNGPFLEHVDYINDKGRVIRQRVKYKWHLVKCAHAQCLDLQKRNVGKKE